jgi:hypothetical protein
MRSIVRHTVNGEELYLVWSSVVEAPDTSAAPLDEHRGLKDLECNIVNDPRWRPSVTEVASCVRRAPALCSVTRLEEFD